MATSRSSGRTGLVLDPYFSGTKFAWMLEHRDIPIDDDLALGTIDSWIIWNLTGGAVFATDVTNASRTMLCDIRSRTWDPDLCDLLGVPIERTPRHRSVERSDRRHLGVLWCPRSDPGERGRRRPTGRAVRPGLCDARDGEEHLRDRIVRAAQRRRGVSAPDRGHVDDRRLDARRRDDALRARRGDLRHRRGDPVAP